MKSSWSSPEGGSSVAPSAKIEPIEAVFCAWWGTVHMGMLSSVLDLLNSEKPLFIELEQNRGRLTTTEETMF